MTFPSAADVQIRAYDPAQTSDTSTITGIYAEHVLIGSGSFELTPPDASEMARRLRALLEGDYPVLVAADKADGTILGYAYCAPYKPRPGYKYTVEDSVYVRQDATGRGIGRALLTALVEQAQQRGYLQIMAAIGDSGNEASVRLHRACGFVEIGTARRIGFKFGRFLDVVYMQLDISGEEG